jgi:AcrR family transcriptional regulator
VEAPDTRESLIESATQVFTEKGFAGARVDEIARAAGANKAMIYYHFGSKERLYKAVLLRQIGGLHEEIGRVSQKETEPTRRLLAFYAALGRVFGGRPALPFMMLREILSGGVHMDAEVSAALKGVLHFVRTTVEEGVAEGGMRPVNPLYVHLSMIAPMMLFCVSSPFRERLEPKVPSSAAAPTTDGLFAHIQDALARTLAPSPAVLPKQELT